MAIVAALLRNMADRRAGRAGPGIDHTPESIQQEYGRVHPPAGGGSNPRAATPGRAATYVNTVTGRSGERATLQDMNTRPGDYLVFLGETHVMLAHVRRDLHCSITDAQIGRGWAGASATEAMRRLLGLAGGGPAARGASGPRPHPYLSGGETLESFSFTHVRP